MAGYFSRATKFEQIVARKKSLNRFWSRRSIFSNILAVWDVSLTGLTEFEAEDVAEPTDRNDKQPSPATVSNPGVPTQELASLACRSALSLLPKAPSGIRNGGWILGVDFGGIFGKCTVLRLGVFCKKSAKNPHPKSAHPVEKSAPKSAPKIRTNIRTPNLHQNPHPKSAPKPSTNTHRDPQRKGHKGCPLSYTLLLLVQGPENQKKIAPKIRYATQGEA